MTGYLLGLRGLTNEFLIGTPSGIERVRTIKRRPIQERWDLRAFNAFRGLPWKYKDVQNIDDPVARGA